MPFDEIPGLFPKDEEAQIAKDNQTSRDRLRQVLGTPVGTKTIGAQTWQVYNKGTAQHPYYVRVAPDPRNPNNLQVWDYNNPNERNPPPSTPIGSLIGDEQLENVRQQLAQKYAYNPRTQQPWNPAQTSYGEVKSAQRYMQTYENFKQPSGELADAYTRGGNALNLFEDIEKQWNAAGGSAGLNKVQQFLGQFKRETDIEKLYNQLIGKGFKSTGDAQTDAGLMFMRDLVRLKGEGQDLTHLQGTDAASNAVANGLNGVLGASGIFHPIIAGIAGTGLEAFKSLMGSSFNVDDFRALEPQAKLQLAQLLYNRVHNDTGPGQILLDQPARDVGNHAKKVMENAGMTPEDNSVPGHAGILQEPGDQDTTGTTVQKAQPAGTTVKKAIPVTPGKAPIQTPPAKGGTNGAQQPEKGVIAGTQTPKMSLQESLDRGQIVNNLKQQPGREKEEIDPNGAEVTKLYNEQKGVKTPQPSATTGDQQKTQDQKKTEDQQTVSPAAASMLGIGGPGITKPEPTGPITPAPAANRPEPLPSPDTSKMFTATQAGVEPGTDIQNITTNRAAEIARLADPNWRPGKAPINQKIDEIVGQVSNPQRPASLQTTPKPSPETPLAQTPENYQKTKEWLQGGPTGAPIPSGPNFMGVPYAPIAPSNDPGNVIQNTTTNRAEDVARFANPNLVPGIIRRAIIPVGPSQEDERQFQQQQELEQQDRARKQLEGTLPYDAAMGAPLGSPDNAPQEPPPMLRLHHQAHVDSLTPGTPFYWKFSNEPYVKV